MVSTVLNSTEWLQTPLGRYVVDWEQTQLDALLVDIFGYNALQLGLGSENLLRANRMPYQLVAGEPVAGDLGRVAVMTKEDALPFASASLDLVVLAHVLEFAANPHQVLREVERVLVAEGSVVIAGFNPFSLWGLTRWRRKKGGEWPWCGQYLSAARVRDWLALLGFDASASHFGCHAPAVSAPEWLARWRWLDAIGRRWWPVCGAAYVVHGIKRVVGARLIQPNWREQPTRAKSRVAMVRRDSQLGRQRVE
ncbi:methyltransferase type 11 [Betaproteobacteria bacterium]|nr:methyltransferase type 11 [Betaproteobacteria bacterium]GHU13373.1 methyltransferase type 11 [Betaproteobacteria bacterium]GHU19901.1 methyltransferase type 11 [Betaproteobacteria bacterium]